MSRLERFALSLGVLVPLLYFGTQFVAARFYPGYSFVRQSASELGSDRSDRPSVLNSGAILTGILTIVAACAFPFALRRQNCPRAVAWAIGIALLSMGAGAIWAGAHPLPDPRHNPRALGAGAFFLPALFAVAGWRRATKLRVYLVANVAVFLLLVPVMSGSSGLPIEQRRGLLQRVAAAVLYVPVGVMAASLLRKRD